jgi:twitching motility protein PilT
MATDLEINKLFRTVIKHGASDLMLKVDQPPMLTLRGSTRCLDMRPLTQVDMERMIRPMMDEDQRRVLQEKGLVIVTHTVVDTGDSFRVKVFLKDGELRLVADRLAEV